tara:strand:+ start:75 stop:305 length:231 start_codon:yes stop_codon:yes gene_type:complete
MNEALLIFVLSTSVVDSQAVKIDHIEWPINITQEEMNSGEAEVYIPIADEFISIKWETICCPEQSNNDCLNCDEID